MSVYLSICIDYPLVYTYLYIYAYIQVPIGIYTHIHSLQGETFCPSLPVCYLLISAHCLLRFACFSFMILSHFSFLKLSSNYFFPFQTFRKVHSQV